jgi:hypothetical protein
MISNLRNQGLSTDTEQVHKFSILDFRRIFFGFLRLLLFRSAVKPVETFVTLIT